jgi:acyl-CoA reductase-like NAD-dependent aldehyde dehydrogenase
MRDGQNDASELARHVCHSDARTSATRRFDVLSPYDGTVIGRAPDIDVQTLASSFDEGSRVAGNLQNTHPIQERLRSWAGRIGSQHEELARVVSLETGKPIRFARVEVATALAALNAYCSCPSIPLVRDWTAARSAFSILNWRDPVLATVKEAIAVLSSGRALVIKPSSRAPLASRALASLWAEGGNLDKLLCVAPSINAIGMLRTALRSSHVTEVRFHGSRDVGSYVSRACHEAVVPVMISQSERAPMVIDADADIDAGCDAVIKRVFLPPLLAGAERVSCLYVHNSVADSLVSVLIDRAGRLHIGDPVDEQTQIGPVIDDVAAAFVSEQVDDALLDGATLAGGLVVLDGRLIQPIVLDHAKPFMRVCVEEAEGPILPVIRFGHQSELPGTMCLTSNTLTPSVTGERGDRSRPSSYNSN